MKLLASLKHQVQIKGKWGRHTEQCMVWRTIEEKEEKNPGNHLAFDMLMQGKGSTACQGLTTSFSLDPKDL